MKYLIDANVILEAKNKYYSFDVCPAFWEWLLRENSNGNILSIEAIANELLDLDVKKWVNDNRGFFVDSDDTKVADIVAWVTSQTRFTKAQINRFLRGADARLISHAIAFGVTVVTHEKSEPNSTKVKIPDVCRAFNVPFKNTFQVLNELRAKFILA